MLSQSVASDIAVAISAGEFLPGAQLSEVRATERFACSRNTLREAFATLAAEQLVHRIPHRGVFIATPNRAYVEDLYAARAAIEPAAVLWGSLADAPGLLRLAQSARVHAEKGEDVEVSGINQRFHRALVAGIGSPTLDKEMGNLLARMRLTFLLVLPKYPQLHVDHIADNVRVAELLVAGDNRAAADYLRASLTRTAEKLTALLVD